MHETDASTPEAVQVGMLPADEKDFLVAQMQKTVRFYKYSFIVSCISVIVLIGFIIAPAMHIGMRKQQKRLAEIESRDLRVFRIDGTLTTKYVGAKQSRLYALSVGEYMLPEVATTLEPLKQLVGQQVSAEYIPLAHKNRRIYDTQGKGYNFMTKTSFTSL